MKKLIPLLLCLTLAAVMLVGCATTPQGAASAPSSQPQPEPSAPATTETGMRVTALNGPTAMGMVKLMDDAENGAASQHIPLLSRPWPTKSPWASPKAALTSPRCRPTPPPRSTTMPAGKSRCWPSTPWVCCMWWKTASPSGPWRICAAKPSMPPAKAPPLNTPQLCALAKRHRSRRRCHHRMAERGAACLAALSTDQAAVAMLPQPFVTTALKQNDGLRVALDLTEEWDAIQAGSESPSALITGVVVARRDFIEQNPEAVSAFLDDYQASVEYVNANVDGAAELVGKYGIVTAEVAKEALPSCNITFIEGNEMKQKLSAICRSCWNRTRNPSAACCGRCVLLQPLSASAGGISALGGAGMALRLADCQPLHRQGIPAGSPVAGGRAALGAWRHRGFLDLDCMVAAAHRRRFLLGAAAGFFWQRFRPGSAGWRNCLLPPCWPSRPSRSRRSSSWR